MPEMYFSRPCPACGGKVGLTDDKTAAVCTVCGKRFRLRSDPKPETETTPVAPDEKSGVNAPSEPQMPSDSASETADSDTEARTAPAEKRPSPLLLAVKRLARKIKAGSRRAYTAIYKKLRGSKIPLPPPPSDKPKEQTPPEPPMDEGQAALYRARQKQLESRDGTSVPPPPPTRGEKLESFVEKHKTLSIVLASVVLVLLLTLLVFGIGACVKNARINKSDFKLYYGTDGTKDRQTYQFITKKGATVRINMTALARLCELTTTGTADAPKYAVRDGSTYVIFHSGSAIALVNGSRYEMTCPAEYDEKGNLWVDLYFADDILAGVTITVDTEENIITATRNTTPEGTILDPVYEPISISAGNRSVYTSEAGGSSAPTATYKTDVSTYAADLNPSDPSYLILANKENPLSEDFIPADLVTLTVPTTRKIELRSSAARALEAMFAEMEADGVTDVSITSGYRSYSYQQALYDRYVSEYLADGKTYEEAVKLVDSDTARPGYSEHQTGLCVDFWTSTLSSLSNEFESTEASKWLRENAWKFGFILRYPSDKVSTTGYTYESWHYRFVGVDAASVIHEKGWCFEEYLTKS